MPKPIVQNKECYTTVSVRVSNELLDEVKKNTTYVAEYFRNAVEEKIYKKREDALMEMIDNFPRVSIEENTTDILRRYRNEE